MSGMLVTKHGNHGPPIESLYAFVLTQPDGKEGMMAAVIDTPMGRSFSPLVSQRKKTITEMSTAARDIAAASPGLTFKIYEFTGRIDRTAELYHVPKQDAGERGGELCGCLTADEVPELATEFAQHYVAKHGFCGGVLHRAYAIYAQIVEGLPCEDQDDLARADDRHWFAERSKSIGTLSVNGETVAHVHAAKLEPDDQLVEQARQSLACKVCSNVPDDEGWLEHGRGCYTQSEDGGGGESVDLEERIELLRKESQS